LTSLSTNFCPVSLVKWYLEHPEETEKDALLPKEKSELLLDACSYTRESGPRILQLLTEEDWAEIKTYETTQGDEKQSRSSITALPYPQPHSSL